MSDAPQAKKGNAGKGRVKGSQNKFTKQVKEMILGALDDVGGQAYLAEQAVENPTAFMTLLGKVLPMQVNGPGEQGEHLHKIVREIVRPQHPNG